MKKRLYLLVLSMLFIGCNESIIINKRAGEAADKKIIQELPVKCTKDSNGAKNTVAICRITEGPVLQAIARKLQYDPIKNLKFEFKVYETMWKDAPRVNFQLPINSDITHLKGKLTAYRKFEAQYVLTGAKKGKLTYWTIVTVDTISPKTYKKSSVRVLFKFNCKLKKPNYEYGPYKIENPKCTVELLQN